MPYFQASVRQRSGDGQPVGHRRRGGRILACSVLFLTVVGCSPSAAPSDPATAGDTVAQARPADESAFLAVKSSAEADYDQAPNDIVKGQVLDRWKTVACTAVKTPAFSGWTGHVTSILSDGGFIVDIGDNVEVEGDNAPGSPVFQAISALHEGDAVTISGRFHPEDDGSCMVKTVGFPFGDAPIKKPDFEVSFSAVSPLST